MIPFPAFEPDKSKFDTNNTDFVANVLPKPGGWGPVPSFVPTGQQITEPIRMVISTIADDGTVQNFCGTPTSLLKYDSVREEWINQSPGVQHNPDYDPDQPDHPVDNPPYLNPPDVLNLPDGEYWGFHQFGDYLLVTNQADGMMYYDLTNTDATFEYVPNAPKAKFVSSLNEYVIVGNLVGQSDTLQWCEVGDFLNWEVGENGADFQELPDGGEIRGMTFGETQIFVLQLKSIRAIQFIGGPFTFQFTKVNDSHGLAAPQSLISAGETFYFYDESGFHRGPNAEPIGDDRVDDWFARVFDLSKVYNIQGGSSPTANTVWWIMERPNGARELVGYNWSEDRWTRVEHDMQYLAVVTTIGTNLEKLDDLFDGTLEGIPYSLDSRLFEGGRTSGGGFDGNGYFGFFSGEPMKATLETPQTKLMGENERTFVNGHRIAIDTNEFTSYVGTAQVHGDPIVYDMGYRPNDEGLVSSRSSGRLHKFKLEIDEGAVWTYVHGVFPMEMPGGRR